MRIRLVQRVLRQLDLMSVLFATRAQIRGENAFSLIVAKVRKYIGEWEFLEIGNRIASADLKATTSCFATISTVDPNPLNIM